MRNPFPALPLVAITHTELRQPIRKLYVNEDTVLGRLCCRSYFHFPPLFGGNFQFKSLYLPAASASIILSGMDLISPLSVGSGSLPACVNRRV